MSNLVKNLVTEFPKSTLPAGYATEGDEFTFFVSGPRPLQCNKYIVDGEAIVFSTGGNAAVHYGKGKFSYSTDCWALQPNQNTVKGKYLYYFLSSQIDRIDALGFEGSGLKHLRKDFIRNYEVPDLCKPEQSKIAEVLSRVDQAIEQTESLIAKQQRIKTGLMQDLLTRGIDEHGNLRSEETHQFKDSPLGRIPVEWEVAHIGSRVAIRGGYAFRSSDFLEAGLQLIRIGNLYDNQLSLTRDPVYLPIKYYEQYPNYVLHKGDLIMSMTGTSGKIDYGFTVEIKIDQPLLLNQRVCKFIYASSKINKKYLLNVLQSEIYLSVLYGNVFGTKQANLNADNILSINIPFPPIQEQELIGNHFEKIRLYLYDLSESLLKLASIKTALMQDLLTGKKRVTPLMENMEVCS